MPPSDSSPGPRRLLLAWSLLVLLLLWWPVPEEGAELPWLPVVRGLDLWAHGALFVPFGLLWPRVLAFWSQARVALVVLGTGAGLGLLTEWGQGWIPGRSPQLGDLGADIVGAFAGWAVGGWISGGSLRFRWSLPLRKPSLSRRLGELAVMALVLGAILVTVPGSADAFDLPKRIWSELFGLVSLTFLAPVLARPGTWNNVPRSPGPLRAGAPLCLLAVLSVAWSAHPLHTRAASVELWIGFACLVGWSHGLSRRSLDRLLSFTLVPGVIGAGLAIGSFYGWLPPAAGVVAGLDGAPGAFRAGAAGDLGAFLVLPLLVAQHRLIGGTSRSESALLLASMAILSTGLAVTGSVTGFVAATFSSVVLWWSVTRSRRRFALAALLLVAIAGALPLTPLPGRLTGKVEALATGRFDRALTGRPDGWRVAVELWSRRPLAGSGWGTYGAEFAPAKLRLVEAGARFYPAHGFPTFENAHDEILEVGAELGAVGLAALVWGLWQIGRAWRKISDENPGDEAFARAGLVAAASISLVYFPFRIAVTAYPFLLFLAWGFRRGAVEPVHEEEDSTASPVAVWGVAVLLVAALGIHGVRSLRQLEADRAAGRVRGEIAAAVAGGPVSSLEPLLPTLREARRKDPGSLAVVAARGDLLLLLERWEAAREAYDEALALEPRAEVFLNRSRALEALGRPEEAAEDRRRALLLDPGLRKFVRD